MNIKSLLLFFLYSSFSWGQVQYSDILYYQGRSLGRTPEAQIAEAEKIIQKVERVTDENGTDVKKSYLMDNKGNRYPVLIVDKTRGHALNEEALRISETMGDLPLIFSPYDLGRSRSNAFFDPDGSKIGVPYGFILGDVSNSSYLHELYHATTYKDILEGKFNIWAGIMKTSPLQYMSPLNKDYYASFSSLDELPATALSLKLDVINILKLKRSQTPSEFNRSRGEADHLLGSIHLSTVAGKYLARQVADLANRALKSNDTRTSTALRLGRLKRTVPTSLFKLDSYSWEIIERRGTSVPVKDGTEWKLYWPRHYTKAGLEGRLKELIKRSKAAEAAFEKTEICIDILIEYPRIEKTDFNCLEKNSSLAFELLTSHR